MEFKHRSPHRFLEFVDRLSSMVVLSGPVGLLEALEEVAKRFSKDSVWYGESSDDSEMWARIADCIHSCRTQVEEVVEEQKS